MRIVSANIFCLNPKPAQAIRAVAAQAGDVTILIESTARFDRYTATSLPPRRAGGMTRRRGMPVSIHARLELAVEEVQEHGLGWLECRVQGVLLLAVHAVAPYLPWRLGKRRTQLDALAERMASIDTDDHAIALGDFNTSNREPVWGRLASDRHTWRRLTPSLARWEGTWPLGGVWAPIALDHALAPAHLAPCPNANLEEMVDGNAAGATVRTFRIPGSDHMGLVVDLPSSPLPPPSRKQPE